jgi:hypothetical protein
LPLLKEFSAGFGLVGGTAIALHLGHRQSIDFDLFTTKQFGNLKISKLITRKGKIEHVYVDEKDEYTVLIDGVKLTFLYYPFPLQFTDKLEDIIKTADILTLAALKAYALGRRAKWKDYVDLYFIAKNYSLSKIVKKAELIFGGSFNEKIFRTQLAYFKDIDYSEKIMYQPGFAVEDKVIKKALVDFSLS